MKRIIHFVTPDPDYEWFKKLILGLKARGFNQEVVTLRDIPELNNFLEELKVPVNPHTGEGLISYLQLIKILQSSIRRNRNMLLLVQGHKPSMIAYFASCFRQIDFGIIHHIQPKYFIHMKRRKRVRGIIHQLLYQAYVRRAVLIQSLSKEVGNSLAEIGVPANRIRSIGHGVDFERFWNKVNDSSAEIRLREGTPRILMVGRLVWEKNYSVAIQTVSILKQSFPNVLLLIAGSGPDEAALIAEVNEKQLDRNVVFLGWVANIPQLMISVDLLLHLSLTESYGQVYIEACLANLPVFTFPAGIAIDLAESGDSLINLISDKNPETISRQIRNFLDDENSLTSEKGNVYERYREHSQEVVIEKICDYLSQL